MKVTIITEIEADSEIGIKERISMALEEIDEIKSVRFTELKGEQNDT